MPPTNLSSPETKDKGGGRNDDGKEGSGREDDGKEEKSSG